MPQEPQGHEAALAEVRKRLLGDEITLEAADLRPEVADVLPAATRYWHALGFPLPQNWTELHFTDADVRALQRITRLIDDGVLDEELALAMTRATARSADRLAVWQAQLLAEFLAPASDEGRLDPAAAADLAIASALLAEELEPMLTYAWRRHLVAALTRTLSDAAPAEEQEGSGVNRVVGFADLVNFTAVVRRATERQLAAIVQRFEELASDIVTAHGGRVIKTVGDEVLFASVEPLAGTAIALDLVDAMGEDPMLPQVRVGVAYGPVISRMGDIFGTTVNRAARLTAIAPTGRVVADEALAARLAALSGFNLHPLRRRNLRGIGLVSPCDITRARGARLPTALAGS
ncbi:MAG: adenylate/guanylate cyclase domain-containing protein [Tetrasphaera sp.]